MNRIFKVLMILMFMSVTLINSAEVVSADVGPKPSVNIDMTGIEGEYYVTILSETSGTGPYDSKGPYSSDNEDYYVFEDYEDEFYFLYNMKKLEGEGSFNWTYYPPEVYKVLIYLPDTDTYLESEIIEAYAFDSYHKVMVDNNTISVSNDYRIMFNLSDYAIRLMLTILIELLIALFFRFSNKSYRIIILTNIITQTMLIGLLMYFNYRIGYFGEMLTMIPLELIVLVTEIIVYRKLLEKDKHPVIYAILANVVSFLAGFYLLLYFV